MNIKYKIDREHIFVTDETGKIRKMPKYEHAEEILKLQNDIESIDCLLISKQMEQNDYIEGYEDYKNYKLILVMAMVLTIGSFLLVISDALPLLGLGASSLFFVASSLAAKKMEDIKGKIAKKRGLSKEMKYLEEIKKNKLRQMEELKKVISNEQTKTSELPVTIIERDNEDTIEECIQMLNNMGEESSIVDLSIAYGIMQEIQNEQEQKQKTYVKSK